VAEVSRPNRQLRRHAGKSDPIDAEAAARAVQAGTTLGQPKTADGPVEMLRALRLARSSAVKARTQAANLLHALVITAPDPLQAQLRGLPLAKLVTWQPAVAQANGHRPRPGPPSWPCGRWPAGIGSCQQRSPRWTVSCIGWSPRPAPQLLAIKRALAPTSRQPC
jgi:hypothetical protein